MADDPVKNPQTLYNEEVRERRKQFQDLGLNPEEVAAFIVGADITQEQFDRYIGARGMPSRMVHEAIGKELGLTEQARQQRERFQALDLDPNDVAEFITNAAITREQFDLYMSSRGVSDFDVHEAFGQELSQWVETTDDSEVAPNGTEDEVAPQSEPVAEEAEAEPSGEAGQPEEPGEVAGPDLDVETVMIPAAEPSGEVLPLLDEVPVVAESSEDAGAPASGEAETEDDVVTDRDLVEEAEAMLISQEVGQLLDELPLGTVLSADMAENEEDEEMVAGQAAGADVVSDAIDEVLADVVAEEAFIQQRREDSAEFMGILADSYKRGLVGSFVFELKPDGGFTLDASRR